MLKPKEMLQLAGKKAVGPPPPGPTSGGGRLVATRTSDRATASQKDVVKKLKDLQLKRAEMVHERKKVRNYSAMASS